MEGESFLAPEPADDDDERDIDDFAVDSRRRTRDDSDDADHDEGDDEPREGKGAARDIPTWKEVIGLIISGNMESRARSPRGGGGPYRGRGNGGRGHSDSRGGGS